MVRRTKIKSIKPNQKKNNIFRFSAISLLVIFSFFTLTTLSNFLDKNLNFKKSIISNSGVNFAVSSELILEIIPFKIN